MKNIGLILLFFIVNTVLGQNKPKTITFGTQFTDTVSLPSKDNYILNVTLKSLPKKHSKQFYNSNDSSFKFETENTKNVTVIGKNENKHILLIPPLNPNRFYKLEVEYVGKYNIYGLFRSMHEDGLTLYKEDKKWMDIVKFLNMISEAIGNMQLLYHPQIYELETLQASLKKINIKKIDTTKLINIYFDNFEILKFRVDEIKIDSLISFSKWIKNKASFSQLDGLRFIKTFNKIPDYIQIYNFYERRLKPTMENTSFYDPIELIEFIKKEAALERKDLVDRYRNDYPNYFFPNYTDVNVLNFFIQYSEEKYLNTYAKDYETSYKRTLVPDFGYIAYVPYQGGVKGGTPYVGVHISLSPVNKDIPLKLSQLTFCQRLSIHTGVTLNSLKKDGYREDFFSNYSLILGGGYKIFTQSTRLNFGGVLFKKTDVVSGISSLAIQPYIGLSIDIEIRKWLEGIIPTFTKNLKSN